MEHFPKVRSITPVFRTSQQKRSSCSAFDRRACEESGADQEASTAMVRRSAPSRPCPSTREQASCTVHSLLPLSHGLVHCRTHHHPATPPIYLTQTGESDDAHARPQGARAADIMGRCESTARNHNHAPPFANAISIEMMIGERKTRQKCNRDTPLTL